MLSNVVLYESLLTQYSFLESLNSEIQKHII